MYVYKMFRLHKYLEIMQLFCAFMFERHLFCPLLIIYPFLITGLGSRIPFSKHLLFFTRTKSLTSSLFKAVSYVLVQHYSTDLLLKWNTAVTFLNPLTFYNLWNLAQQQEFNHIHWCKRQNKAPLRSDRDMTSRVQSLQRLTGDPQGQSQWSCLWSSCNLWLCLLITLAEICLCEPELFCYCCLKTVVFLSKNNLIFTLSLCSSLCPLHNSFQMWISKVFDSLTAARSEALVSCTCLSLFFFFFLPRYESSASNQLKPLV